MLTSASLAAVIALRAWWNWRTVAVLTTPSLAWYGYEHREAFGTQTCWLGAAARAAATNAVVATWVVLAPGAAVGAVGVPVRAGDASGALAARAVVVALKHQTAWQ